MAKVDLSCVYLSFHLAVSLTSFPGEGVRCMSCGKELTELFNEESQVLGYGSGCDPKLYADINRHRHDEASFRADSSAHLLRVESERVRLEKERRVMEEDELYFYDFADLRVIYEFDQRHATAIKKSGTFRQGLQWTDRELDAYQENRIEEKRQVATSLRCLLSPLILIPGYLPHPVPFERNLTAVGARRL